MLVAISAAEVAPLWMHKCHQGSEPSGQICFSFSRSCWQSLSVEKAFGRTPTFCTFEGWGANLCR